MLSSKPLSSPANVTVPAPISPDETITWAPDADQASAGIRQWLFDAGSLTQRLTIASEHRFTVTPLHEGWQPLRADECQALGLAEGSEGWVREVFLRGRGEPWVFARSVAGRQALEACDFALQALGTRSLGQFLFSDPAFIRQPFDTCRYPYRWLPREVAAHGLWARRSRFDRQAPGQQGLSVLVTEVFLPTLWRATGLPDEAC
ncbi:chorismate lyase [Pseudomonas sp. URIL14HWK12:I9]|nr:MULTISPECIES: chorismate lyase [unclassified Pseudomonas]PVZ10455.1 chorismate lyase [Pseudomonas sp. URIL14HWK12:I12]PVZ21881.1 chorismate lyase [Pseudomonas sp. URIL14HWK12:I10]PVZ31036.1 chorismate lyase [Pseudomonas sp. URIL14HWK12:I11]SNZ17603.1 chorismate lyase [Pseudomonas sp. URIL14HWK12:I9]